MGLPNQTWYLSILIRFCFIPLTLRRPGTLLLLILSFKNIIRAQQYKSLYRFPNSVFQSITYHCGNRQSILIRRQREETSSSERRDGTVRCLVRASSGSLSLKPGRLDEVDLQPLSPASWQQTFWTAPGSSGSQSPCYALEISLDLQGKELHIPEGSFDPFQQPVLQSFKHVIGKAERGGVSKEHHCSIAMWQLWNAGRSKLQRSCGDWQHLLYFKRH